MLTPEQVWNVDPEYGRYYDETAWAGAQHADVSRVAIVGIVRNAMPVLENTLGLVSELRSKFHDSYVFFYENDSVDGTVQALDRFAIKSESIIEGRTFIQHDKLGGADERGFQPERTVRLAACRNRCVEWVRSHAAFCTYTIVLDMDPQHGFSVDGVMNSVGQLHRYKDACGMASYSLLKNGGSAAHYDAWAARPTCWWRDRRNEMGGNLWFHSFVPPVGAPPVKMNSAFGGLAVYWTRDYLEGEYSGVGANGEVDCEHVAFHKSIQAKTSKSMYLNPGSRYIAIWQDGPERAKAG